MINQISIKTKVGWISAQENKGKIYRIKFGKLKKQKTSKILDKFKKNLVNFLNHKTIEIKIPHLISGNNIQKKTWNLMKRVKKGQTLSYGKLAKKLKITPRYVGRICGQNKLVLLIPCHRIIRGDGTLGGFTAIGGIKLKEKLLNLEKRI